MLRYSVKILVAFSESLKGNKDIFEFLLKKQPELAALQMAIAGSADAYRWLVKHKFMHLAAFSDALEGDAKAYTFLERSKQTVLAKTVRAINKDMEAYFWLDKNAKIFTMIVQAVQTVNNKKTEDDNDVFMKFYKTCNPFS